MDACQTKGNFHCLGFVTVLNSVCFSEGYKFNSCFVNYDEIGNKNCIKSSVFLNTVTMVTKKDSFYQYMTKSCMNIDLLIELDIQQYWL